MSVLGQVLTPMAVAFVAIGAMAFVLRWTFGQDEPRRPPADEDYGLLRIAARAEDAAHARRIRAALAEAGIRATITHDHRVLVFPTELDRARRVTEGP